MALLRRTTSVRHLSRIIHRSPYRQLTGNWCLWRLHGMRMRIAVRLSVTGIPIIIGRLLLLL